ncbi:cathelicidin-5-like [Leptodactylus fuscus]|uniref:cathelicidin-5-like n=1 Tax=Leptodactylus fuscus TaxID=238119 RepID=UPI003F4E5FDE
MAVWFISWILLAAATSQSAGRAVSPPTRDYISQATALYNSESDGEGVYRELGVPPEEVSDDGEHIRFLIKETVCLKTAQNNEKCPFKEDGGVKMCTASLAESGGSRMEVSCQIVDLSDNNLQAKRNHKSKSERRPHVFQLVQSEKKKLETNFRQFDNKSLPDRQAVSCLSCIFDFLNPNKGG